MVNAARAVEGDHGGEVATYAQSHLESAAQRVRVGVVLVVDDGHVGPTEVAEHAAEHLAHSTLAVGEASHGGVVGLVLELAPVTESC